MTFASICDDLKFSRYIHVRQVPCGLVVVYTTHYSVKRSNSATATAICLGAPDAASMTETHTF